jgi:hypothetical protein
LCQIRDLEERANVGKEHQEGVKGTKRVMLFIKGILSYF